MTSPNRFDNLPDNVLKGEWLTADSLAAERPFLTRYVEASIPPAFRYARRLSGAERFPIPFADNANLWAFNFAGDKGVDLATGLVWKAGDGIILVDFLDTTFYEAMRTIRSDETAIRKHSAAYLSLYFETGRAKREGRTFALSMNEVPRPKNIDADAWASLLTKASSTDAHAVVDRREGKLFEVTLEKGLTLLANGCEFPSKDPETLIGLEEPWRSCTPLPNLELSVKDRRENRARKAAAALRRCRSWKPSGIEADVDAITLKAQDMYDQRHEERPWVEIFPSKDDAVTKEVGELFAQINERCLDFHVSRRFLRSRYPFAPPEGLRVLRKALSFYSGHRHYQIIDRRGGHPRRTEILFAPSGSVVPDGVDRLVPLNGHAETIHRLNAAYRIGLENVAAVEYLDFFCDAVHGPNGPFHIVESIDDAKWRGPAEDQRNLLRDAIRPIRLWPNPEPQKARSIADALCIYADAISHALFDIDPGGFVTMKEDFSLVERLDVAPELFTTRTHFLLREPAGFKIPERSPAWSSQ